MGSKIPLHYINTTEYKTIPLSKWGIRLSTLWLDKNNRYVEVETKQGRFTKRWSITDVETQKKVKVSNKEYEQIREKVATKIDNEYRDFYADGGLTNSDEDWSSMIAVHSNV